MTADNPQGEPAPLSLSDGGNMLEGGDFIAKSAQYPTSQEKPNKHAHIRDKIRASKILQRLEADALGELDVPMTSQQIRSAEITLKKVIPDLQAIQHTGEDGGAINLNVIAELRRTIVKSS